MSWAWHYLAGIALFSMGMVISFGPAALFIVVGIILMIGGIGQFFLTKISQMSAVPPQEDQGV